MSKRREPNPTYTPKPTIPHEEKERYEAVVRVLSGEWTVTEAAKQLGMSRNRFQSLMHRGLTGLQRELAPQPPGRPKLPEKEALLQEEVSRLRRENERLKQRVDTIDRLLGVASDMIQGRLEKGRPRQGRTSPSAKSPTTESSDDDGDEPDGLLRRVEELLGLGISRDVAAALAGVSTSTLRRWQVRRKAGRALVERPRHRDRPAPSAELEAAVSHHVRALQGQVGAESLRHSVPGVSRRQAATIKRKTLTQMERERIERCGRVQVGTCAVVRSFDAMHTRCAGQRLYLLVCADAAVPHRTSIVVVERYDSASVAAVLDRDFAEHGAPLVLRMDRASCHRTDEVAKVLKRWGVLALHGPPRHPCFYGQLERQNREHRCWLESIEPTHLRDLAAACEEMRRALNGLWKRPSLGWSTAEDVWNARLPVHEDRNEMLEEVNRRTALWLRTEAATRVDVDAARRLAIESWLTERGYLRVEPGMRC